MFTHALPQGSLRPFEPLPPTLTPNAILAMAPPAPRRLGFLGACVVYAGCGLAMTLAPSLTLGDIGRPRTERNGFEVPAERPHIEVELTPKPPTPMPSRVISHQNAPVRDANWAPPSPMDAVPETPDTLPTKNRFADSIRGGDPSTSALIPQGAPTDQGNGMSRGTSAVIDYDFRQMRILSKVDPSYPPIARLAKIQGEVVLLMVVDPHGLPTEVKALSGPHPSLELEAMRVARLWRFEPATMNGQPVSAQFKLTILFRLK